MSWGSPNTSIFMWFFIGVYCWEHLFSLVSISIILSMSFNILYNCVVIDQNGREMLSRDVKYIVFSGMQPINRFTRFRRITQFFRITHAIIVRLAATTNIFVMHLKAYIKYTYLNIIIQIQVFQRMPFGL